MVTHGYGRCGDYQHVFFRLKTEKCKQLSAAAFVVALFLGDFVIFRYFIICSLSSRYSVVIQSLRSRDSIVIQSSSLQKYVTISFHGRVFKLCVWRWSERRNAVMQVHGGKTGWV